MEPVPNLYSWPRIARAVVCVCTAYRPRMLEECLLSLREQLIDQSIAVEVVVVDNEPEPNSRDVVASIAYGSIYPMHYVHEPKRGIATARNAALEKALQLKADWIACIDDDETAEPDWVAQLMHPDYLDVPVLMGANIYRYPRPLPFWAVEESVKGTEGQVCKTAYTGNVRFSADIARAGFRFDERLGFMGGEDNEFFARVHAAGWAIRRTLRAVTHEAIHPERLTYHGQIYRAYWCAASELRRVAITRGWLGAAARKVHTIPLNLISGMLWLVSALPAAVAGPEAFKEAALMGGKHLAKAAGRMVALLGISPQPYRIVRGR